MRVPFAFQVLSKPTVVGIRTYNHLEKFLNQNKSHAESTALFIKKFSKLFNCLNSKTHFHNLYCRGLRMNICLPQYRAIINCRHADLSQFTTHHLYPYHKTSVVYIRFPFLKKCKHIDFPLYPFSTQHAREIVKNISPTARTCAYQHFQK